MSEENVRGANVRFPFLLSYLLMSWITFLLADHKLYADDLILYVLPVNLRTLRP